LNRPALSMKTQLRIGIVTLVTMLVFALGLVTVRIAADANFSDAIERAQMAANQVRMIVELRVNEKAAQVQQPPATPAETIKLFEQLVRDDPALPNLLQGSIANANLAVEILVADHDGIVLASSTPTNVGNKHTTLPRFDTWRERSFLSRFLEVYTDTKDYEDVMPLGADNRQPALTIRVVVSSRLLWNTIKPQIYNIGAAIVASLLLSAFLAALYSNIMVSSLARLSERIEALAAGTFKADQSADPANLEAKEFAVVQSKLDVLGRQFQGAKDDVVQMRSSVEQMLERLAEAVLLVGPQQRIISASHAAERMLFNGQPAEGKLASELLPTGTPLGDIIEQAKHRGVSVADVPVDLPPLRLLVNVEVLKLSPDSPPGFLITLRDAETRRQLRTQLDFSTRLAAISRLTGGVAHEIKNPLNAIALHLEILRSRLTEFPDMQPEVEVISSEISRLDRVVKTFLDFTRPVDLQMRTVSMPDVVKQVAHLISPEARRAGVQVEVETGSGELVIRADEDLLKQALLNVVNNGVDAMDKGGQLVLRLERSGEDVLVSIQDQGAGIPDRVKEKIFNLYFTTKPSGSGIGLAMTFRIVQLLNGSIDFSTASGIGTTFRLRFPAVEVTAPASQPGLIQAAAS
jgi:nitrogen-specific signal transduction histidine kinase